MKKIILLAVVFAMLFSITACTNKNTDSSGFEPKIIEPTNLKEATRLQYEKILTAIKNKDSDTIKGLFANYATEKIEQEDLDKGIEYMFNLFEGEIRDATEGFSGGKSINNGKKIEYSNTCYSIKTEDGGYYVLYFKYCWKSEFDKNIEGIWSIKLSIGSEDLQEKIKGDYSNKRNFIGVYHPEWDEKEDPEWYYNESGYNIFHSFIYD